MNTMETVAAVLNELAQLASPKNRSNMVREGINVQTAFGVPFATLREIAKRFDKNNELASAFWGTGNHEARLLAPMIADESNIDESQLEHWVKDIDSWDISDLLCNGFVVKTQWAWPKAAEWARADAQWTKRCGFVLMASLSVHDKKAEDQKFINLLTIVEQEVRDERNFVKKAISWALRGIGRRNMALNSAAISCAERIAAQNQDHKAARWVANDALRKLKSEKVQKRLSRKGL